jgi:DNA modification methylase
VSGSGTTGVAVLLEGRRFLGVEIAGEYHVIARDRLCTTVANAALGAFRAGQAPLFGSRE